MSKFADIEESPNHLKLLSAYGNTAVTLSLGLLTVSVAFAEKLLRPPVDLVQSILLVLLWIFLFLVLICGVIITACLTRVAAYYVSAKRIAYPDALELLSDGQNVNISTGENETISKPCDEQQKQIKEAIGKSKSRAQAAIWWANLSFVMFCISALLICVLGFYSSIYIGRKDIGKDSAIASARESVTTLFQLPTDDAQLESIGYDVKTQIYVVKLKSKKAPGEAYVVTIDGVSGRVTNATRSP